MTDEPNFEGRLRDTLQDADAAFPPPDGLADRLIANAVAGRRIVTPLRRRRRPMVTPLLVAVACVLLVVGIVWGVNTFIGQQPSPGPAVDPPAPSSTGQSTGPPAGTATTAEQLTDRSETQSSLGSGVSTGEATGNVGAVEPGLPDEPWLTTATPATGTPPGFHAAAAHFADADTGWLLGDAACPEGDTSSCPALVRTDDGGESWSQLSVPDGLSSATLCSDSTDGSCVNNVTFDDREAGYLWSSCTACAADDSSALFVTTDGGMSWQQVADIPAIGQLVIVGGTTFTLGDPMAPNPAVFRSAPIGSTDFRPTTLPWDGEPAPDVRFVQAGAATAYALAVSLEGDVQLLRFTDGSWTSVSTGTICESGGVYSVAGARDGSLLIGCSGSLLVLPASGTEPVPAGLPAELQPDGQQVSLTVFGAARSATEFAVLGQPNDPTAAAGQSWYVTADGGNTWSEPREFGSAIVPWSGYDDDPTRAQTDGALYVLTALGGQLLSSNDSGQTWQARPLG